MTKARMSTIFVVLMCCAIAGFGLFGCSTTSSGAAATKKITDAIGRQVEIPSTVNTAVINGYSTRMVVYAGAADKLIGVADIDKTGVIAMPYASINKERFNTLPSTSSGGAKNVSYQEQIITLNPDVIISTETDVSANNELQEKTGKPVIVVDQSTLFGEATYNSLSLLGDVFGTKEHTDKVITAMKGYQADLASRTTDISEDQKPTVYTGAVSFKGAHGFEGTYAQYAPFVAVNAKNVVDETGLNGALLIDLEKVAVWNPQYIFLNPENMNLVNQGYASNPDFYNNLTAVQKGNIYSQPSFNYNGTNFELAIADAYYVGKIVYPDRFSDIEIDEKADEIFKAILGSTYIEQLNTSGRGFNKLSISG